jgi:hypothetical protein
LLALSLNDERCVVLDQVAEKGFYCRLVNAATLRFDGCGRVGCVMRTREEVKYDASLHLASICMRMSLRRVIL